MLGLDVVGLYSLVVCLHEEWLSYEFQVCWFPVPMGVG